jgi:sugar phosphate isomerase/epimerase
MISRRKFIATAARAPFAFKATNRKIPVGLEMYSVRDDMMRDMSGTLRALSGMGYKVVEFYAPYFEWTVAQTKQMRRQMDDLGLFCRSTHNGEDSFTPEGLKKAVERNQILGSRYIVMAGSGPVSGLAGWKGLCDRVNRTMATLTPLGMSSGFHNHEAEWVPIEGKRPMDILAAGTPKEFMLQLDVGSCVAAKQDPVAWIKANPGRIRSIHCKDWAHWPWGGYRVLFGEGDSPWDRIFEAAENAGGVEFYLIEQEGSRYTPLETARRCMANWNRLRSRSSF